MTDPIKNFLKDYETKAGKPIDDNVKMEISSYYGGKPFETFLKDFLTKAGKEYDDNLVSEITQYYNPGQPAPEKGEQPVVPGKQPVAPVKPQVLTERGEEIQEGFEQPFGSLGWVDAAVKQSGHDIWRKNLPKGETAKKVVGSTVGLAKEISKLQSQEEQIKNDRRLPKKQQEQLISGVKKQKEALIPQYLQAEETTKAAMQPIYDAVDKIVITDDFFQEELSSGITTVSPKKINEAALKVYSQFFDTSKKQTIAGPAAPAPDNNIRQLIYQRLSDRVAMQAVLPKVMEKFEKISAGDKRVEEFSELLLHYQCRAGDLVRGIEHGMKQEGEQLDKAYKEASLQVDQQIEGELQQIQAELEQVQAQLSQQVQAGQIGQEEAQALLDQAHKGAEEQFKQIQIELRTPIFEDYRDRVREINRKYDSYARSEQELLHKTLEKQIEESGIDKATQELFQTAYNETLKEQTILRAMKESPFLLSPTDNARRIFGNIASSMKGISRMAGSEDGFAFWEDIEKKHYMRPIELATWSDVANFRKFTGASAQLFGRMAPSIAAGGAAALLTGGLGASVFTSAVSSSFASWMAESADMAGTVHQEVLESTGSVAKAEVAGRKMMEAQVDNMILYTTSSAPFFKGWTNWAAKGRWKTGKRALVGAKIEYIEEFLQEVAQGAQEEQIRHTAIEELLPDYKGFKITAEHTSRTMKEIMPVLLFGGGGGAIHQVRENISVGKGRKFAAENHKALAARLIPGMQDLVIYDLVNQIGVNQTKGVLWSLAESGTIEVEYLEQQLEQLDRYERVGRGAAREAAESINTQEIEDAHQSAVAALDPKSANYKEEIEKLETKKKEEIEELAAEAYNNTRVKFAFQNAAVVNRELAEQEQDEAKKAEYEEAAAGYDSVVAEIEANGYENVDFGLIQLEDKSIQVLLPNMIEDFFSNPEVYGEIQLGKLRVRMNTPKAKELFNRAMGKVHIENIKAAIEQEQKEQAELIKQRKPRIGDVWETEGTSYKILGFEGGKVVAEATNKETGKKVKIKIDEDKAEAFIQNPDASLTNRKEGKELISTTAKGEPRRYVYQDGNWKTRDKNGVLKNAPNQAKLDQEFEQMEKSDQVELGDEVLASQDEKSAEQQTSDVESTAKALEGKNTAAIEALLLAEIAGGQIEGKSTPQVISEAYHRDKAAGKETELTKAVESLLSKEQTTTKEVTQPGIKPKDQLVKGDEVLYTIDGRTLPFEVVSKDKGKTKIRGIGQSNRGVVLTVPSADVISATPTAESLLISFDKMTPELPSELVFSILSSIVGTVVSKIEQSKSTKTPQQRKLDKAQAKVVARQLMILNTSVTETDPLGKTTLTKILKDQGYTQAQVNNFFSQVEGLLTQREIESLQKSVARMSQIDMVQALSELQLPDKLSVSVFDLPSSPKDVHNRIQIEHNGQKIEVYGRSGRDVLILRVEGDKLVRDKMPFESFLVELTRTKGKWTLGGKPISEARGNALFLNHLVADARRVKIENRFNEVAQGIDKSKTSNKATSIADLEALAKKHPERAEVYQTAIMMLQTLGPLSAQSGRPLEFVFHNTVEEFVNTLLAYDARFEQPAETDGYFVTASGKATKVHINLSEKKLDLAGNEVTRTAKDASTVVLHEGIHVYINAVLGFDYTHPFWQDFQITLTKLLDTDAKKVLNTFSAQYKKEGKEAMEYVVQALALAASGEIKLSQSTLSKIIDFLKKFFSFGGNVDLNLKSTTDVFNFVKMVSAGVTGQAPLQIYAYDSQAQKYVKTDIIQTGQSTQIEASRDPHYTRKIEARISSLKNSAKDLLERFGIKTEIVTDKEALAIIQGHHSNLRFSKVGHVLGREVQVNDPGVQLQLEQISAATGFPLSATSDKTYLTYLDNLTQTFYVNVNEVNKEENLDLVDQYLKSHDVKSLEELGSLLEEMRPEAIELKEDEFASTFKITSLKGLTKENLSKVNWEHFAAQGVFTVKELEQYKEFFIPYLGLIGFNNNLTKEFFVEYVSFLDKFLEANPGATGLHKHFARQLVTNSSLKIGDKLEIAQLAGEEEAFLVADLATLSRAKTSEQDILQVLPVVEEYENRINRFVIEARVLGLISEDTFNQLEKKYEISAIEILQPYYNGGAPIVKARHITPALLPLAARAFSILDLQDVSKDKELLTKVFEFAVSRDRMFDLFYNEGFNTKELLEEALKHIPDRRDKLSLLTSFAKTANTPNLWEILSDQTDFTMRNFAESLSRNSNLTVADAKKISEYISPLHFMHNVASKDVVKALIDGEVYGNEVRTYVEYGHSEDWVFSVYTGLTRTDTIRVRGSLVEGTFNKDATQVKSELLREVGKINGLLETVKNSREYDALTKRKEDLLASAEKMSPVLPLTDPVDVTLDKIKAFQEEALKHGMYLTGAASGTVFDTMGISNMLSRGVALSVLIDKLSMDNVKTIAILSRNRRFTVDLIKEYYETDIETFLSNIKLFLTTAYNDSAEQKNQKEVLDYLLENHGNKLGSRFLSSVSIPVEKLVELGVFRAEGEAIGKQRFHVVPSHALEEGAEIVHIAPMYTSKSLTQILNYWTETWRSGVGTVESALTHDRYNLAEMNRGGQVHVVYDQDASYLGYSSEDSYSVVKGLSGKKSVTNLKAITRSEIHTDPAVVAKELENRTGSHDEWLMHHHPAGIKKLRYIGEEVPDQLRNINILFGIPVEVVSRSGEVIATIPGSNKKLFQMGEAKPKGFYDTVAKKAFLVEGEATLETSIHEAFTHPFLEAIKTSNPKLYKNLAKEAQTLEDVVKAVAELQPNLSEEVRVDEVIAHAIDKYVAQELDAVKNRGLIEAIVEFFRHMSEELKAIFNIDTTVENLSPALTLRDLAQYSLYGTGKLDLSGATTSSDFQLEASRSTYKGLTIGELREEIDKVDTAILDNLDSPNLSKLFKRRGKIVLGVAEYKKSRGLPVEDKAREGELIGKIREKAQLSKVDPDRAEGLFRNLIEISKELQRDYLGLSPGNRASSTQKFFSEAVTGSVKHAPNKPYDYVLDFTADEKLFKEVFDAFKGSFDEHIATSIPTFRDTQVKVGSALVKMLDKPPKLVNEDLKRVRDSYMKKSGITTPPKAYNKFDKQAFREMAEYHKNVKDDRKNPVMQKSYRAFLDETKKQYEALVEAGYKIEPWLDAGEPYGVTSDLIREDVAKNKHLSYLRSRSATGESDHNETAENYMPFESTGIFINGDEVLFNDLFRAVHDIFGHAFVKNTFSTQGELDAYITHASMYSQQAQKALFLETVMYNAWYNEFKNYAPRKIYDIPQRFLETVNKTPLVYDIGGSEGGFVKAISEVSEGRVATVNLEPNQSMAKAFNKKPTKRSEVITEAFYEGFDNFKKHTPKQKADVVHESMVFQFISSNRSEYLQEVKSKYLKTGGLFLTEEKLIPVDKKTWEQNEAKKDKKHKSKYYSEEQVSRKQEQVLTGMLKNQTYEVNYQVLLEDAFEHVVEYWDAGNFKGFVASDSKDNIVEFLGALGGRISSGFSESTSSDFQLEASRSVPIAPKTTISNNTKQELERVKNTPFKEEDGATFNIDGTKYEGGGLIVPISSENTTIDKLSPEMIADFVHDNQNKIGDKDLVKVGIYKFPDSDGASIDLNIVVPAELKNIAVEFGRLAGQESLFDLDTFTNIKTGATGQNPVQFTDTQFREIARSLKGGMLPGVFQLEASKTGGLGKRSELQDALQKAGASKLLIDAVLPSTKLREGFLVDNKKIVTSLTAAGFYSPLENTIWVDKFYTTLFGKDKLLIHEAVHAATVLTYRDVLADPGRYTPAIVKAVNEIQSVAQQYAKNTSKLAKFYFSDTLYGTTNPLEFIAEFVANPRFRYWVGKNNPTNKTNVVSYLWTKVLNMLGVSGRQINQDLINRIDNAVDVLLHAQIANHAELQADYDSMQQLKNFGVSDNMVQPVGSIIDRLLKSLRDSGITQAKSISEWLDIRKALSGSPQTLKQINIGGQQVTVRPLSNQLDIVNGFYSPIEKALLDNPQNRGTASQFLSQIKKAKGVKADELQFTGVEQWLTDQGNNKITKQDILDFMKDNRVEIVEVVKGGEVSEAEIDLLLEDEMGEGMTREEARDYLSNDEVNNQTKHQQYQLEGEKENYKEVLVTLPIRTKEASYTIFKDGDEWKARNDQTGKIMFGGWKSETQAELWVEGRSGEVYDTKSNFKSTHFPEPNILVHLRMNTRTDAEGNKVLFLEELQSDWGQKGKKEGFDSKAEQRKELEKRGVTFNNNGTVSLKSQDEFYEQGETWDLIKKYNDTYTNKNIVPTAPFVTSTPSWVKLGIKTAIKEAVAQGATKIAWTTGEQQNDRYDLSKSVDSVEFREDTSTLYAYKDGNEVLNQVVENKNQIADYIGKDVAERLIAAEPDNMGSRMLEGEQLKIGGSGMKGFYDNIVPSVAKAVVKELTGQEGVVGEVGFVETMTTDGEAISFNKQKVENILKKGGTVYLGQGEFLVESIEELNEFIEEEGNPDIFYYGVSPKSTQQSIEITPELAEAVSQGLPLFQQANAQYRVESGKNIIEALRDFDKSEQAVAAIVHEIMHPVVVEIFNGTREGNEVATRHANTIVEEYNKANPGGTITLDEMVEGNEQFKEGNTTNQYRAAQEFIAEAWERYNQEGAKGFSKDFQQVLNQIAKAFKAVYNTLVGKELTPELKAMFEELLGKTTPQHKRDDTSQPNFGEGYQLEASRSRTLKNAQEDKLRDLIKEIGAADNLKLIQKAAAVAFPLVDPQVVAQMYQEIVIGDGFSKPNAPAKQGLYAFSRENVNRLFDLAGMLSVKESIPVPVMSAITAVMGLSENERTLLLADPNESSLKFAAQFVAYAQQRGLVSALEVQLQEASALDSTATTLEIAEIEKHLADARLVLWNLANDAMSTSSEFGRGLAYARWLPQMLDEDTLLAKLQKARGGKLLPSTIRQVRELVSGVRNHNEEISMLNDSRNKTVLSYVEDLAKEVTDTWRKTFTQHGKKVFIVDPQELENRTKEIRDQELELSRGGGQHIKYREFRRNVNAVIAETAYFLLEEAEKAGKTLTLDELAAEVLNSTGFAIGKENVYIAMAEFSGEVMNRVSNKMQIDLEKAKEKRAIGRLVKKEFKKLRELMSKSVPSTAVLNEVIATVSNISSVVTALSANLAAPLDLIGEINSIAGEIETISLAIITKGSIDPRSFQRLTEQFNKMENALEADYIGERIKALDAAIGKLEKGEIDGINAIVAAPQIQRIDQRIAKLRSQASIKQQRLKTLMEDTLFQYEQDKLTRTQRVKRRLARAFGIAFEGTRSIVASADHSAVFQQGNTLTYAGLLSDALVSIVGNEKIRNRLGGNLGVLNSFARSSQSALDTFMTASYEDALVIHNRMTGSEKHQIRLLAGLEVSEPGDISSAEEMFVGTAINRVALVGRIKMSSEVAMTLYLNMLRVTAFDNFLSAYPDASIAELQQFAAILNEMTGRKKFEGVFQGLNKVVGGLSPLLFAPRLYASRAFWFLRQFVVPVDVAITLIPGVRHGLLHHRKVARQLIAILARSRATQIGVFATLGMIFGGAVGDDPEDSTFGKYLFGTRAYTVDPGSFQLAVLIYGMIQAENNQPYDAIFRYIKYKLHPFWSSAVQAAYGADFLGRPYTDNAVTTRLFALQAFLPISIQQAFNSIVLPGIKDGISADKLLTDTADLLYEFLGGSITDFDSNIKHYLVKEVISAAGKGTSYTPAAPSKDLLELGSSGEKEYNQRLALKSMTRYHKEQTKKVYEDEMGSLILKHIGETEGPAQKVRMKKLADDHKKNKSKSILSEMHVKAKERADKHALKEYIKPNWSKYKQKVKED